METLACPIDLGTLDYLIGQDMDFAKRAEHWVKIRCRARAHYGGP